LTRPDCGRRPQAFHAVGGQDVALALEEYPDGTSWAGKLSFTGCRFGIELRRVHADAGVTRAGRGALSHGAVAPIVHARYGKGLPWQAL